MTRRDLAEHVGQRWSGRVHLAADDGGNVVDLECPRPLVRDLCGRLFLDWDFSFGGLIVEEGAADWHVRYVFYGPHGCPWVHVLVRLPLTDKTMPSIVREVHAADWHEREAEDLFGLIFEGHPRLGDFVLHDDAWQEGVEPMRHRFSATTPITDRRPKVDWRPHRVLEATGAFVMPVGPVFAGLAESVHFGLETVGEDVTRAMPRLFYKYRGVEKIAEGQPVDRVLLLAERFAATTAFAHGLAFSQAIEAIAGVEAPPRARTLRVFVAELERLRHHAGAIAAICDSTALAVAASQAAMLEEELLRESGALAGHRYLFGLVTPGGLAMDLGDGACGRTLNRCRAILGRLLELSRMLQVSSSFLDRLEEVGRIAEADAREVGLVGPMARGSGVARDLRQAHPYAAYDGLAFDVPAEREGDGYARLRVLVAESRESVRLMEQAVGALRSGPVFSPVTLHQGAALGAVEAPRGAALHWVRVDEAGRVARYRIVPPSFVNWLGFHLAVEEFAFQDFPIILSTLDLSVAETDR